MINLDRAALNAPHPRVDGSITQALLLHRPSGNALGVESRDFLASCKSRIAGHLGRDPIELSFLGSGTAAIRFISTKLRAEKGFAFYVPATEHNCSLSVADFTLQVGADGQLSDSSLDPLRRYTLGQCGEGDVFVISLKNNETGIVPGEKVRAGIAAARRRGMRLVVDATGGDWKDTLLSEADYVFASAGKWHGLPGLGLLCGTKDLWDDQPTEGLGGVVGGSPNMVGISCLADAMDWIASSHGVSLAGKNSRFLATIEETAAGLGWQLNGSGSFIANYYTGLPSDLFLQEASDAGLSMSAGSACNSGMSAGSHVITAMLGEERAGCSLRLSWDRLTKDCDLLGALEIVKKTDRMLRAYRPEEKVND